VTTSALSIQSEDASVAPRMPNRMSEPPDGFKVTVITPVYNAADRVRRAVESAVALPEVGEVILIEDGSPDDALVVCTALAGEYENVRLLRHEDGGNHGAGASRNLGLKHARFPFVAFLDADDWYLPNRFRADAQILTRDASIDGVYNALGNHYESDALREKWLAQGRPEVLTVSAPVEPEELVQVLFWAHPKVHGEFHTITITVRREFINRSGGFHPALRLQQDTHLWKRMAAAGRLAPGNIEEPVAIRSVHAGNRMTRVADHEQYLDLWWASLRESFKELRANETSMQAWRRAYAGYRARKPTKTRALVALAGWLLHEPREFLQPYGHFDLTLRTIFGNHRMVDRLLSLKNHIV
jgi:glycosyltransferase involved in cell wall biosynthesis